MNGIREFFSYVFPYSSHRNINIIKFFSFECFVPQFYLDTNDSPQIVRTIKIAQDFSIFKSKRECFLQETQPMGEVTLVQKSIFHIAIVFINQTLAGRNTQNPECESLAGSLNEEGTGGGEARGGKHWQGEGTGRGLSNTSCKQFRILMETWEVIIFFGFGEQRFDSFSWKLPFLVMTRERVFLMLFLS